MFPDVCHFLSGFFLCLVIASSGITAERVESFDSNPLAGAWRVSGDASLFQWDATARVVRVTWDSSRSNSFFWRPLETVLSRDDDFAFEFDLRVEDVQIGTTAGKPAEFPIAVGLIHRGLVTNTAAYRGAGMSGTFGVRNLVEWNFFPDGGFGDTWATTVVSSNNVFAYAHTFPVGLIPGDDYHVALAYSADDRRLRTMATRNGQPIGPLEEVDLGNLPDFRVEAFSATSYSDAVQAGSPVFHGSVRAHGMIDNVRWSVPRSPVAELQLMVAEGMVQAAFSSRSNWVCTLERSVDLREWSPASPAVAALEGPMILQDSNPPGAGAFYRVRADRP